MADEVLAVVIDTGSYKVKAGFSGADTPQVGFRSLVAYGEGEELVVGNNALKNLGNKSLMQPIQHGIVRNWGLAEKIWEHLYEKELKVKPNDYPVLLAEPPLNPKIHREKCCQLFFEAFMVPGMYMAATSLLSLYGSAKTCGLVLDIGQGVAHAVPISDGTIVPHAVRRVDVGGYDVTSQLMASIRGLNSDDPMAREIANEIKETCCYVALDYQETLQRAEKNPETCKKTFTLPDGFNLTLSKECFQCPEIIFSPEVGGRSAPHLTDVMYHSIRNCEPELHRTMFSNILISGGSSLFRGFPERCEKELKGLINGNSPVKIVSNPKNRDTNVWLGGSIVASLSSFQQMWVTKADYEESGPTVIHRKCF